MNYDVFVRSVCETFTIAQFQDIVKKSNKAFTLYGDVNNENLGRAVLDAIDRGGKYDLQDVNKRKDWLATFYDCIAKRTYIFTYDFASDFPFLQELFDEIENDRDVQGLVYFQVGYIIVGNENGYDVVQNMDGKYNFMDDNDGLVFDEWFDEVSEICEESHAFAVKDGKHYELWFDPSCLEDPSKNYWEIKMRN